MRRTIRLTVIIAVITSLLQFAMPALAWDQPICYPKTGEVHQPDFKTDAAYNDWIKKHPGSYPMGTGDKCDKPKHDKPTPPANTPTATTPPTSTPQATSTPAPTNTPVQGVTPAATATPTAPAPPQPFVGASHHEDQYCHWEPTTGLYEIRLSDDLLKTLNEPGNVPITRKDVCAQPTPIVPSKPTATPTPVIIQIVTVPEPVTPPVATTTPTPAPQPPEMIWPAPDDETPPEPTIPTGLPTTGGDDGCSYYGTCLPYEPEP